MYEWGNPQRNIKNILTLEFDPSSGRTLAACLKHASRTDLLLAQSNFKKVFNFWLEVVLC